MRIIIINGEDMTVEQKKIPLEQDDPIRTELGVTEVRSGIFGLLDGVRDLLDKFPGRYKHFYVALEDATEQSGPESGRSGVDR